IVENFEEDENEVLEGHEVLIDGWEYQRVLLHAYLKVETAVFRKYWTPYADSHDQEMMKYNFKFDVQDFKNEFEGPYTFANILGDPKRKNDFERKRWYQRVADVGLIQNTKRELTFIWLENATYSSDFLGFEEVFLTKKFYWFNKFGAKRNLLYI